MRAKNLRRGILYSRDIPLLFGELLGWDQTVSKITGTFVCVSIIAVIAGRFPAAVSHQDSLHIALPVSDKERVCTVVAAY